MPEVKTSKRPKKKPLAPRTSDRPKKKSSSYAGAIERGNRAARMEAKENASMGMKKGGKVKKMAKGGKCRGMGAASRGGNYKVG